MTERRLLFAQTDADQHLVAEREPKAEVVDLEYGLYHLDVSRGVWQSLMAEGQIEWEQNGIQWQAEMP